MPRGGYFATAPEDPAYYDALAEGSSYGIAGNIAEGAVAGVAAPLMLRNKRRGEAQAAKDRQEMAMQLFDAAVSAGETEQTARLVALQYLKTGETSMAALLQGIRKGVGEDRLNTAKIGTEESAAMENRATAGKTMVETELAPSIAEADIYSKRTTADAATTTAGAAKTNAYANLQGKFAERQGMEREQLFAEFKYFDKNGDGQIDREEAEKARMAKRQEVRKEMEAINEEWDAYDALPAEAKANTPAPTSKRIAPEDIASEADRRAEEYLNDLNDIRLTNNDFLGRIGKTPLTPKPGAGGGSGDTQAALAEIGQFAGQKPTDPEGLMTYLKSKYPGMDEAEVRKQLGI